MNKKFQNSKDAANTKNFAGGKAYAMEPPAALAQLALTGTFYSTHSISDTDQIKKVKELADQCSPEFIAKLSLFARERGLMKDLPAFLVAYLANKNTELCKAVFPRVINDAKMLKNFVFIMRSGVIDGNKSLGTVSKKLVQSHLTNLTDNQLFRSNVGGDVSLADVIKLSHPKPTSPSREALYAYILGKEKNPEQLPELIKQFEAYKKHEQENAPDVPFQMLTALPLSDENWKQLASNMTFNQLRINLNTLQRHKVLDDPKMEDMVAEKLQDREEILRSRTLPYQLFAAFKHAEVSNKLKVALQNAADISLENTPKIDGKLYIGIDVSGSMSRSMTGDRKSATTKMRYVDVAALFASALLRRNPDSEILPFDTAVRRDIVLNPLDSIMTNAQKLAVNGGGTDCSAPLLALNQANKKGDAVIVISDNESWRTAARTIRGETGMMAEWKRFKNRNPQAKLVLIDLHPGDTNQVPPSSDILCVGGFSDAVFDVVNQFLSNQDANSWIEQINALTI